MKTKRYPSRLRRLACLAAVFAVCAAAQAGSGKPADPFDYSYCGSSPVYPVIGYNFATACGPRNQIALGRRGLLMWLFPEADGEKLLHRGSRQLPLAELKRISLLAEVAQFSDPGLKSSGPTVYDLGINFSGRPYMQVHAALTPEYTPANELFRTLLSLVPDRPLLPECAGPATDFSPTLNLPQRRARSASLPNDHAPAIQ